METFNSATESASSQLVYALKPTSKRLVLDRKTVSLDPENKSDFKSGETVQFKLDGDEFVDPHSVYVRGTLRVLRADGQTPVGAAALPRLYGGAIRAFSQMRLLSRTGQEIEKIEAFNIISDIMNNCCLSEDYLKANGQMELLDAQRVDPAATTKVGPLAAGEHYKVRADGLLSVGAGTFITSAAEQVELGNRIAVAACNAIGGGDAIAGAANPGQNPVAAVARGNAYADKLVPPKYETKEATDWIKDGKDFCIPLFKYLGFLKQGKYLPMKYLGSMKLEMALESNAYKVCKFQSDPTDATVKLSGLKLVYDTVRLNDILIASIDKQISESPEGLPIDFRTYHHVTTDNTSDSSVTLTFDKGATDCLSAYAVIRPQAVAFGTDSFEYKSFAAVPNVLNWQYKLGSFNFPQQPVTTYSQSRAELDKSMGHLGDGSRANLSMAEFSASKFVMGIDLENDPSSAYTGRSTNSGSQLKLTAAGLDTAAAKTFDGFLLYTRVVRIKSNFNIAIEE